MAGHPRYTKACRMAIVLRGQCREFFSEYNRIAVIHLRKKVAAPEDIKAWSRKTNIDLLKLENAAFLSGYYKAFLLFMDE